MRVPGLLGEGSGGLKGAGNIALLCSSGLVGSAGGALCDVGLLRMLPQRKRGYCGVVLFDCFVYAFVLELPEAVCFAHLDDGDGAGELAGVPHVLYEKVCDGDGFCSCRDAYAPLSGL